MLVCYVDEAGCVGTLPSATSQIQPVFIILGLIIDESAIVEFTNNFIGYKRQFFPKQSSNAKRQLDTILCEIKGSDIRRDIRSGKKEKWKFIKTKLNALADLLTRYDARLIGRVWIKGVGEKFNGRSVYTSSVQSIYTDFNQLCASKGTNGIVIADNRNFNLNSEVAHSLFTRKFKARGDDFPRVVDVPVFGNSSNHAGIQIADIICSALLFPMATYSYCTGYVDSVHVNANYGKLKQEFGRRIMALQYRYHQETTGKTVGGITVSDPLGKRSGRQLFLPPLNLDTSLPSPHEESE